MSALCAYIDTTFYGNKFIESWSGDEQYFSLTNNLLQLTAPRNQKQVALSTHCSVMDDAEWEIKCFLRFNPSGSNNLRFYVVSDSPNLRNPLNGYFVQMGNASDQILLYRQSGSTTKKIAAGQKDRLNLDSLSIILKVKRSTNGEWSIFSKINNEKDYTLECSVSDSTYSHSYFTGFLCKFSATRCESFLFDYVSIKGDELSDNVAPFVQNQMVNDTCIQLFFSERMESKNLLLYLDSKSVEGVWNDSYTQLMLPLASPLSKGKPHYLSVEGLADMAGNSLKERQIEICIEEMVCPKDIIINEVLFHPYEEGVDYVELYNRSEKYIQLSDLRLATYRSDSIVYAAKALPYRIIAPQEYVVITSNQEAVCKFYDCQDTEAFVVIDKLPTYGNSSGNVVLATNDNLIIDELRYNEKMHSELLKNREGVALERLSPNGNEWTSAAESAGFGTPGYLNSNSFSDVEEVALLQNVCSPVLSNDGNIIISYSLIQYGYVANVSIFNLNGVLVRHLAQNQLLGTNGEIVWDGKSDSGVLLPIAPYIILFEAHNAQGDVIRKKFVGVVGE